MLKKFSQQIKRKSRIVTSEPVIYELIGVTFNCD